MAILDVKSEDSKYGSQDTNPRCEAERSMVAACQRGDREAQHRLYDQYKSRIFRLMVRMVGSEEAADLTQQVFLQVYTKIHQFSGRSQFGTWLYRVAVNEALQYRRRRQSRPSQPLQFEPAVNAKDVEAHADREAIERALGRVDPELRAIFLLREVDQLSYGQLAEILGIVPGTVASRLNRARRELRAELERLDAM